jgi:hypothetical protein
MKKISILTILFFCGIQLIGNLNLSYAQTSAFDAQKNELKALTKVFNDAVLYTADGRYLYLGFNEAENFCKKNNSRLLSAREFVKIAVLFKARGLASKVPTKQLTPDFTHIAALDENGNLDSFYYSNRGYIRRPGDFFEPVYWTSTRMDENNYAYPTGDLVKYAYVFDPEYARFLVEETGEYGANINPEDFPAYTHGVICATKNILAYIKKY